MQPLLIARDLSGENLQRDVAIELRIACQIHFAHPALTNLRADFITSEFCARRQSHRFMLPDGLNNYRPSKINIPATIPSTARPVVTVEESLMLSNGNSPVRISQSPSKIVPKFLPARLVPSFIRPLSFY
jgi:hypothetical protein